MVFTQLRVFCLLTIVFLLLNLCSVNSEPIRANNLESSSTKFEKDEPKTTESTIKDEKLKPRNIFYPGLDYSGLISSLTSGLTPGYTSGLIPGYTSGLTPGYTSGLVPGFAPGFAPGFRPGFGPGFGPGYGLGYGYGPGYPIGDIENIDPFFLQPYLD